MKRDCPNCAVGLGREDLPMSYNGYGHMIAFCPACGAQLIEARHRFLHGIGSLGVVVPLCIGMWVLSRDRSQHPLLILGLIAVINTPIWFAILLKLGKSRQRYELWRLLD